MDARAVIRGAPKIIDAGRRNEQKSFEPKCSITKIAPGRSDVRTCIRTEPGRDRGQIVPEITECVRLKSSGRLAETVDLVADRVGRIGIAVDGDRCRRPFPKKTV